MLGHLKVLKAEPLAAPGTARVAPFPEGSANLLLSQAVGAVPGGHTQQGGGGKQSWDKGMVAKCHILP